MVLGLFLGKALCIFDGCLDFCSAEPFFVAPKRLLRHWVPPEIHPKKISPKKGPQTPKFPLLLGVWGFGGLFLGEGPRNLSQILGAPKHPPNTHKSKNMALMRSSLLSLLLEHSFEEEETATMLIMLPHPGEATT